MKLHQKILAVMAKVGQLEKDKAIFDRNGKKMYDYLSEETTTGELQRAFIEVGLVMLPIDIERHNFYIEGIQYDKPFKTPVTEVVVTYKIIDPDSGDFEIIKGMGQGTDSQDKGSNKAMTGAFKYAQRQCFLISTGDDGDHEVPGATSGPKDAEKTPSKPPTPAPKNAGNGKNADLLKKLADEPEMIQKCKEIFQSTTGESDVSFEAFMAGHKAKGRTIPQVLEFLKSKQKPVAVK